MDITNKDNTEKSVKQRQIISVSINQLTPSQIVDELNKYIIGQDNAKKSVAIALRNRWRRQQVVSEMKDEIMPNNIIMIGPTGVGKTEIARRISKLANAPFLKVEASKFTEVGYVGRDVESMIRELTDLSVNIVKTDKKNEVQEKAEENALERILDIILPQVKKKTEKTDSVPAAAEAERNNDEELNAKTREKFRKQLKEGKLNDRIIELDLTSDNMPMMQVLGPIGLEEMGLNLQDLFGNIMPKKSRKRKLSIVEAKKVLAQEEAQKLIDMDSVIKEAIDKVQNTGIIFIDEIDKIAGTNKNTSGADVSREGVQRDLLPIVEGSTVITKYGPVKRSYTVYSIRSFSYFETKRSDSRITGKISNSC